MPVRKIDNRGLPPPQPMVNILQALQSLEPGETVEALMDREPFPLYAELGRRGFEWSFTEENGESLLRIWRSAP